MPIANKTRDHNRLDLIKSLLRPGISLLEIGSGEVTGPGHVRMVAESVGAQYVGFDYYPE
jgi:hypothetical protein